MNKQNSISEIVAKFLHESEETKKNTNVIIDVFTLEEGIKAIIAETVKQTRTDLADKVKKQYEQDALLTATEVMNRYHLSRTTLWRWERAGILTPHRAEKTRKQFFRVSDVEKAIAL